MKVKRYIQRFISYLMLLIACPSYSMTCQNQGEILSLWNNSQSREAIIQFIKEVTTQGGSNFIQPSDRIAVLDNDGTLWSEKPLYRQFLFAFNQIKNKSVNHPKWKKEPPYQWVLEGDTTTLISKGWSALLPILATSQSNMSPQQYSKDILNWLATAQSPRFHCRYTDLVYQPMIQLIDYLYSNNFKIYIVTGAGGAFVKPWSKAIYGIPAENVIGTAFGYTYHDGTLTKNAKLNYINDGANKAINIETIVGKRPIFAVGNSDGDQAMLQWTTSQKGPSFGMLIHHTDGVREWRYGPNSFEGKFSQKLLDAAKDHNWSVMNMKTDWCQIFPTLQQRREL